MININVNRKIARMYLIIVLLLVLVLAIYFIYYPENKPRIPDCPKCPEKQCPKCKECPKQEFAALPTVMPTVMPIDDATTLDGVPGGFVKIPYHDFRGNDMDTGIEYRDIDSIADWCRSNPDCRGFSMFKGKPWRVKHNLTGYTRDDTHDFYVKL